MNIEPSSQPHKVICPVCHSDNIHISVEQSSAKTRYRRRGCLWGIGRALLIICTCGLWLIIGRTKGKSTTYFSYKTIAVCQNCGNQWTIDNANKKL